MAKAEKNEGERGEKRKREEEKEENETGLSEDVRVCFCGSLKIFWSGGDLESDEDLSWEDPLDDFKCWSGCEPDSRARVRKVPDVNDVLVSPSSVVTELCDVSSCCSDWEFVEPQSFSFSKKRVWMRYERKVMGAVENDLDQSGY